MRKTYIATTSEAKALHDGTQTAIIVKHSNKQPYAIGQEVVVREAWQQEANYLDTSIGWGWELTGSYLYKANDTELSDDMIWRSPATMPVSAARTRFIPVSCEAVRVQEPTTDMLLALKCNGTLGYAPIWYEEYQRRMVAKLGQSAWDNNDYIFYYKIEKI
jgi:hypothetical protein